MEFKSTNGKFTVSLPDEVRNAKKQRDEDKKSDEAIEINLRCLEEEVTLWDLAHTIFNDLFGSTKVDLSGKIIECWITNEKGESYTPIILHRQKSRDSVLSEIASQWLI